MLQYQLHSLHQRHGPVRYERKDGWSGGGGVGGGGGRGESESQREREGRREGERLLPSLSPSSFAQAKDKPAHVRTCVMHVRARTHWRPLPPPTCTHAGCACTNAHLTLPLYVPVFNSSSRLPARAISIDHSTNLHHSMSLSLLSSPANEIGLPVVHDYNWTYVMQTQRQTDRYRTTARSKTPTHQYARAHTQTPTH